MSNTLQKSKVLVKDFPKNSNLNICYVSKEYAHPLMGKTGGIGVFVKTMAQELFKQGFNTYVFSFGPSKKTIIDNGVKIFVVKDLNGSFNKFLAYWKNTKLPGYNKLKFFLIYINKLYISILASKFSQKHKIQITEFNDYNGDVPFLWGKSNTVLRCHGSLTLLNKFMGYGGNATTSFFEKKMFSNYKENIIAVSEYAAFASKQSFHLSKQPKVIYNGISTKNLDKYKNETIINKSLFHVGSLTERKGIFLACDVFNILVEKDAEVTLHLLGNNVNNCWNNEIKPYLSAKALKRTTYYGTVDNSQILSYLSKAHAVIFPSFGENFSIALLEALSIGKFAVTSNIPAFKEIIVHKKNGFIAKNTEDYIIYILKIFMEDTILRDVKNNAIQTIKDTFDLNTIVKENINYYKELI